jgi:excisionase family DNA binding protein
LNKVSEEYEPMKQKTRGHAVSARRSGSTPAPTRRRIRQETRAQLLERLTNPQITLHETAVILRVCPATVRNYCNSGYLPHERTAGRQRRFRLKDVLEFARAREAERRKR